MVFQVVDHPVPQALQIQWNFNLVKAADCYLCVELSHACTVWSVLNMNTAIKWCAAIRAFFSAGHQA